MMPERDLQQLVKRIAARALAEQGREHAPRAEPERAKGVFVTVEEQGGPDRPLDASERQHAQAPSAAGRALVTVECLRGVASGGQFAVPAGALITELAREEAWKRRIALVEGAALVPGRRLDARLIVAVGCDHGGYPLKRAVLEWLRELGHQPLDLGTHDENPVDYPDFAHAVARSVAEGRADIGICIDGAGIGSAMTANKVPGILAAMCYDAVTARNAREHNCANVLTLGGKLLKPAQAQDIVRTFLSTPHGEERHRKRVDKIRAIEQQHLNRAQTKAST